MSVSRVRENRMHGSKRRREANPGQSGQHALRGRASLPPTLQSPAVTRHPPRLGLGLSYRPRPISRSGVGARARGGDARGTTNRRDLTYLERKATP
jgi:hypothetical protein